MLASWGHWGGGGGAHFELTSKKNNPKNVPHLFPAEQTDKQKEKVITFSRMGEGTNIYKLIKTVMKFA